MKNKKRVIALLMFAIALFALPTAGVLVESSASNVYYIAGAATDENILRDAGSIIMGGGSVLGALSILCGVQTAIVVGAGL